MIEVSVGIIAKNEEKHIKQLAESLKSQSYNHKNFEVILVDGNSSDNTVPYFIDAFKGSDISYKVIIEKDEVVKRLGYDKGFNLDKIDDIIKKKKLYGHCFARNLVIKYSSKSSKYIAFIDADCVAERDWLKKLVKYIKNTDDTIAGVGGRRYIAETNNKMEIIFNSVLTSVIAMGGNPAFSKRNVKYIKSIAGYNSIYKKEVLVNNPFDEKLLFSDDIEINLRLLKKGYKFLYAPDVKVFHHETDSLKQFSKNMRFYGINISHVIKKYKSLIKMYVPLTLLFLFWPVFSLIWILIAYFLSVKNIILFYFPLFFYIFYFIFLLLIFFDVLIRTKDFLRSWLVFIIVPIQHFCYGYGVILGVFFNK